MNHQTITTQERNTLIFKACRSGVSKASLARIYRLSQTRVAQIYNQETSRRVTSKRNRKTKVSIEANIAAASLLANTTRQHTPLRKVKAAREAAGLELDDVAEVLQTKRANYYNLERGYTKLLHRDARILSAFFGISLDEVSQ